jgi:hypothetical protein
VSSACRKSSRNESLYSGSSPHRNQPSGANIDHGHVGDKLAATKSAHEIKVAPQIARIPVAGRPGTRLSQRLDNRSRQVVAHEEGVHAVGVGAVGTPASPRPANSRKTAGLMFIHPPEVRPVGRGERLQVAKDTVDLADDDRRIDAVYRLQHPVVVAVDVGAKDPQFPGEAVLDDQPVDGFQSS